MKSYLKNYRQSPRKVRLVGNLVKGKSVERAQAALKFLNKRASRVVEKLLDSAVANAKNNNSADKNDLYVKGIEVNEGPTLKRIRPRARGSAFMIRKRTSNVSLELGKKEKDKITEAEKSAKPKVETKQIKSKSSKA